MTELSPSPTVEKINELLVTARRKVYDKQCELASLRGEGAPGLSENKVHYNCSAALSELRTLSQDYLNLKKDIELVKHVSEFNPEDQEKLVEYLKNLEIKYE